MKGRARGARGEGEAGEFCRGTVGVSIVLPIEGGRAPRVGVRRHVGGLESHCVGVAGEVSELDGGTKNEHLFIIIFYLVWSGAGSGITYSSTLL